MKKLALLLAAPLAFLAGCGSDSATVNTVATGAYNVSGGTATAAQPNDNCNMVQLFAAGNPPINVVVTGAEAKFDLKGGQTAPQYFTTAAIAENAINHVTDADFETVVGATCTFRTKVQVHGEITANNEMHLIAKYDISNKTGSTCTITDVDTKVLPCTSEVDFLAKKQ